MITARTASAQAQPAPPPPLAGPPTPEQVQPWGLPPPPPGVGPVSLFADIHDQPLYGTFELCAEEALDRRQVAALIADVLGREITAKRIDPDTLGPEAKPMRPKFDHYEHFGLRGNALTLRAVFGREPRTLRAYFGELAGKHQQP